VSQVNTAVLKVASDDWLTVVFNGVELINTAPSTPSAAFLVLDLKSRLIGSSDSEYRLNILEMRVYSDANWEGLLYRIEITFNG